MIAAITRNAAQPTVIYVAQFYHPALGWLTYDGEFSTREAAEYWCAVHRSPYRMRVVAK